MQSVVVAMALAHQQFCAICISRRPPPLDFRSMGSIKRTLNGLFFNVEAFQLCHSLTAAETRQFDHPLVVFISKTKKG